MKKLLFRKFLKDTLKFFAIILFTFGFIVWVIQAVNFLDFVTEDGHSLYVYFFYSIYNFPKIIHRILPFAFFISLFYQISQYELKNELLIFWTNGINKITFINVVITYSIIIILFQIFLGSFISPAGQNEGRTYIRNSNIDFFPSLIKEGKFIDTVSNLTIFIGSQDESGTYHNIFLKDDIESGDIMKSQLIYAKRGKLINKEKNRFFKLYSGKMINMEGEKITNIAFETIDFNLAKYQSKTITHPKIQESKTKLLVKCLYYNYKNKLSEWKHKKFYCQLDSLKNIKQELLKRTYKPIYFPIISLLCCMLILKSKESRNYNFFKIYLFCIIFFTIVISEISLRFASTNNFGLYFFIFFPILFFLSVYIPLITKFKNKI